MKIFYIFWFSYIHASNQNSFDLWRHECIIKKEAELYFNETLSLEVKE